HAQGDDQDAAALDLLDGLGDLPAHQRAGQDQGHRPGQPGHRPHGVGQVGLAHDRDGVDADLLAPDVVPVGLADRPDGDLPDLGAGADHDDPLAPDLVHGGQALQRLDHVDLQERALQPLRVVDAVQLPVDDAAGTPLDDLHQHDVAAVTQDGRGQ